MDRENELTDGELARLLSGRNQLSVLEREQLRERVVSANGAAPPWWSRRFQPLTLGALSTAAAVAIGLLAFRGLLVVPGGEPGMREDGRGSHPPGSATPLSQSGVDTYTARGAGPVPTLDLVCVGAAGGGPCAPGKKLAFTVRGSGEWKHFAAFARGADGTIYWYFPSPGATGLKLEPSQPTLLDRAVVLGDEAAAPLIVYGVFSREPLTRDEIKKALGPELMGDGTVSIVKRQLQIEEDE